MPWLVSTGCSRPIQDGVVVNDAHAAMNQTVVRYVKKPETLLELKKEIAYASRKNLNVCICGGKHALGKQQFATKGVLVDTTKLKRIHSLDQEIGIVKVEAGIRWPELMDGIAKLQKEESNPWVIRQKQGGSDELCIGGTLSANAHGRGLNMKPIVDDIEFFEIITADGELVYCSRTENPELFSLAIGGYGLFGIIYTVGLRLMRREKLKKVVRVIDVNDAVSTLEEAAANGAMYGDFQYNIDESSPSFFKTGICTWYEPVDELNNEPISEEGLTGDSWLDFLYLACTDRTEGFDAFTKYSTSSDGNIYWSDTSQLSAYNKDFLSYINKNIDFDAPMSLMLSELYVPRSELPEFMSKSAAILKQHGIPNVYGTVRMIEEDNETFLPWAKEKYACIIFNLLVKNTESGKIEASNTFRDLIDAAIGLGGNYYLTYHKWARKDQLLECYPQMPEFIDKKKKYDPKSIFESDWYRHQKKLIS